MKHRTVCSARSVGRTCKAQSRVDVKSDETIDFSKYREHFSPEQIDALLHYGHIIPISRGFTDRYLAEHHPGWQWNDLIHVFDAAGIRVCGGGCAGYCVDGVRFLHFDNETSFAVEWEDETE